MLHAFILVLNDIDQENISFSHLTNEEGGTHHETLFVI